MTTADEDAAAYYAHIKAVVDRAPELTEAQKVRLAVLFRPDLPWERMGQARGRDLGEII